MAWQISFSFSYDDRIGYRSIRSILTWHGGDDNDDGNHICIVLLCLLLATYLPRDIARCYHPCAFAAKLIAVASRFVGQDPGIARPRILVCELNPHAGGTVMNEEVLPLFRCSVAAGTEVKLNGLLPIPCFSRNLSTTPTPLLAVYHDRDLPVLKYGLPGATNGRLGLPDAHRVDHGTALNWRDVAKAGVEHLYGANRHQMIVLTQCHPAHPNP